MTRATIADLAREAGVSVATVDRVLNGRMKVREETALKVHDAARRIGYHGTNAIKQRILADKPEYHFGVILQKEQHAFYQNLARQLEEQMQLTPDCRIRITTMFAETTLPGEVAEMLRSMGGKVQAVAATGLDHSQVTAAVADLRARNIPTISLLSDFAQGVRESYLGVNNLKVGRAVGWLMSSIAHKPGKVGIFTGGYRFHGHELREAGFRSSLREYAPQLELLDTQINLETRKLTYEATADMLDRHPDLTGIYCVGGGMEGAISAVRDERPDGSVTLIVNELTLESRQALQDRIVSIVMATPLQALCAELRTLMVHAMEKGMAETPGQRFLPFEIWTPESL